MSCNHCSLAGAAIEWPARWSRWHSGICGPSASVFHSKQRWEEYINIKAGRVGGFAEARAIHDVSAAFGAPVWCGGMLESGIGRAHNIHLATLSNCSKTGDTASAIRELQSVSEPKQSEQLQRDVWGEADLPDNSDILLAIQHEGGLVAGMRKRC